MTVKRLKSSIGTVFTWLGCLLGLTFLGFVIWFNAALFWIAWEPLPPLPTSHLEFDMKELGRIPDGQKIVYSPSAETVFRVTADGGYKAITRSVYDVDEHYKSKLIATKGAEIELLHEGKAAFHSRKGDRQEFMRRVTGYESWERFCDLQLSRMNNVGQAIGAARIATACASSGGTSSPHGRWMPIYWKPGLKAVVDLNTKIDPKSGWYLFYAWDIDDQGRILCIAAKTDIRKAEKWDGPRSFVLLTPRKEKRNRMLLGSGADPWVIRHNGRYVWCRSENNGIALKIADTIEGLAQAPSQQVWKAPATGPYSKELWAPELHEYQGRWYVYVAADDGNNDNHRMIVLRSEGSDMLGPYEDLGPLKLTPDRWAIDGTLMPLNDKLYFIWSGWEGTENVAQNLYICPMADPVTPSGERVLISKPEHEWEKRGSGGADKLPTINEGPQFLVKNGTTHIIYSAAGSWCDDYCLGRLTLPPGADPLDAKAWKKHPEPVFQKTETIFAPGHCSFVDNRIVYHTARASGSGWDRVVRAQPFTWEGDTPVFGVPQ